MPWVFDEENVVTEFIEWCGSQTKACEALGVSTTVLRSRRRSGEFTADEAVFIEEYTKGEFSRSKLRPDLWPARYWTKGK